MIAVHIIISADSDKICLVMRDYKNLDSCTGATIFSCTSVFFFF